MNRKGYRLSHVIIIIILTAIISAVTTGVIVTSSFSANGKSYSDLVLDENVQEFLEVYAKLTDDYYRDVDKKKMISSAINAMTDYLDEIYTTYLNSDNANILMDELNGKHKGIGVTIRGYEIIDVMEDSPAFRSGIKIGDRIVAINGTNVETLAGAEISNLIKQNEDSITVTVIRNEETLEFTMKAEEIQVSPVEYHMIENTSIGYLKMSIFSNNLFVDTSKALEKLKEEGMNKLIIDLRNNTGGYLEQAKNVASLFLEKDKTIYYLENKDDLEEIKDTTDDSYNMPIVVLVNGSTASAAEILSGALKYSYGAILVGSTTYGKGKVQHTMSLSDNDMIKYTSSKWLMPNKVCIDGVGISPDYIIDNSYNYDTDNSSENEGFTDNGLNKAIELLS